jgi:hypothetical protein
MRASRECAARKRRQYLFLDRDRNQSAVVTTQATAAAMITAWRCIMHSRERRRVKLDQELREPSAAKSPWESRLMPDHYCGIYTIRAIARRAKN